jgi:hypothetical protein
MGLGLFGYFLNFAGAGCGRGGRVVFGQRSKVGFGFVWLFFMRRSPWVGIDERAKICWRKEGTSDSPPLNNNIFTSYIATARALRRNSLLLRLFTSVRGAEHPRETEGIWGRSAAVKRLRHFRRHIQLPQDVLRPRPLIAILPQDAQVCSRAGCRSSQRTGEKNGIETTRRAAGFSSFMHEIIPRELNEQPPSDRFAPTRAEARRRTTLHRHAPKRGGARLPTLVGRRGYRRDSRLPT